MKIKKEIPNIISLLNALCGSIAIYFAFAHNDISMAIYFMLASAVLDFFDGFAARKLGSFSPLGKDIDSLSDVISFGVAPAAMMTVALDAISFPYPMISLIIVPASVYRLAKFNNDTRQTTSFIGLPTPANALFFAGLAYGTLTHADWIQNLPIMIEYKVYPIYAVVLVLMSYLLISEVPMFSLKSKGNESDKMKMRMHWLKVCTVFTLGLISLIIWHFTGFAVVIMIYICINLFSVLKKHLP